MLHKPKQCNGCQFVGQCQVCNISEIRYEVDIQVNTEVVAHQVLSLECLCENSKLISGSFPQNITGTMQYGDNLEALVITLNTAGMMGIKRTHDILSAVFGIPISTGTVFSMVRNCSVLLKDTVEKIRQKVCELPLVHFDETGVRVDKKLHWVHSASNHAFTYLTHAACNAHLLREMIGVVENHPQQTWTEEMMQLFLHMKTVKERFVQSAKTSAIENAFDVSLNYKNIRIEQMRSYRKEIVHNIRK